MEPHDLLEHPIVMTNSQTAVLGGGCFWCVEAVFDRLQGVTSVESGYMGGHVDNPTYRQVCTGNTGHVEVVRVTFDPTVLTYRELLDVGEHSGIESDAHDFNVSRVSRANLAIGGVNDMASHVTRLN